MCHGHYKRWQIGKPSSAPLVDRAWSSAEVEALRRCYAQAIPPLEQLARKLDRDKANVCRKARELGLTNQKRPKVAQLSLNYTPPSTPAELSARMSRAAKLRIETHGHPRGALGLKHSPATLEVLSQRSRAAWARPDSGLNAPHQRQLRSDAMHQRIASGKMRTGYSRGRMGRRSDLGNQHFRSSWEANYARFLNWLIKTGEILSWEFEKHRFVFEAIRFGTRSYLPDFKVNRADGTHEWHEVKGWMDAKSATKLKRMAKYYPAERVLVIGPQWFKDAKKSGLAGMVGNWE